MAKTFYDEITVAEQSTAPTTPPSGFHHIYPKTDGKLYSRNASGTEYDLTASGSGGITRSINVVAISTSMGSAAATDYVYVVTAAATMTLPAPSGNDNIYTVKNNHTSNITIDTVGAELVEGAASIQIGPEESVDLVNDNSNWFVI